MKTRRWTIGILLATVAGLIGWDVYAVLQAGGSATISDVVLDAATDSPVLALAVGVLLGHLFWPQRRS